MMPLKSNYQKGLLDDYQQLEIKNNQLSDENKYLKYEKMLLEKQYQTLQKNYIDLKQTIMEQEKKKYQSQLDEKNQEIARLKSLLNNDGTNCGIPTSKTPINKNKVIPNSRTKSSKKVGGQIGHKRSKLQKFEEEELNEIEYVELDTCPNCNHELIDTNETIDKDVLDYKLIVVKKRIKFKEYKCSCCGKTVHSIIPNELKEENQYGPNVKALVLELLNEGYVSINRVKRIINGFTENEIDLSEGYIAKIQKQASKQLAEFDSDLRSKIMQRNLLYWDDTVIFVDKKRSCLRFYGDDRLAFYVAHLKKNKEGLDEDNILQNLDEKTKVMHDHNKVNYNQKYSFFNLECNAHLQRDLEKVINNLDSKWAKRLKELISSSIQKRQQYIQENQNYHEEFANCFFSSFEDIMLSAMEENKVEVNRYYKDTERALILRILDYKENYFAWIIDFKLPITNNLSERSLRSSKTKLKVSGHFKNIDSAKDFARIKGYIETCYRNGINPYDALFKLSIGLPLTLDAILAEEK